MLDSREAYGNDFIRVREDRVIQPDGKTGSFAVVEWRHPGVGIVALTDDEQVYLVRQFRYGNNQYLWETPGGNGQDGEDPLASARRELHEETGLRAGRWDSLGHTLPMTGMVDAVIHLFLARELRQERPERDGTESISVRKLPLCEALREIEEGGITEASSVVALYRAWRFLSETRGKQGGQEAA